MKINNYKGQFIDKNVYNSRSKSKENAPIHEEKEVNIEISNSARELVKRIKQADDTIFSEKVESIRRSIQSGVYQVSSKEIADKILEAVKVQKGSEE